MQGCPFPQATECNFTEGSSPTCYPYHAFDGLWNGGSWKICNGAKVKVNVTFGDGTPSINGIFLRLLSGVSWDGATITVTPMVGGILGAPVLQNVSVPTSVTDISGPLWSWVPGQEVDFLIIEFGGLNASSSHCLDIVEVGFNGTCEVLCV